MTTVTISDARRFSLERVQRSELVKTDDLEASLLCFEAGQRDGESRYDTGVLYQVLEGEALVRRGGATERLGKGRLHAVEAGTAHAVENAGGGLLVVLVTRPRRG